MSGILTRHPVTAWRSFDLTAHLALAASFLMRLLARSCIERRTALLMSSSAGGTIGSLAKLPVGGCGICGHRSFLSSN